MSGAKSGADDDRGRSSDITLDATTTRLPAVPSFLASSPAATLLTSGATQVGNFT